MSHKRLMALAAVAALLAGCGATAPKAASSTGSGAEAQAQANSPSRWPRQTWRQPRAGGQRARPKRLSAFGRANVVQAAQGLRAGV